MSNRTLSPTINAFDRNEHRMFCYIPKTTHRLMTLGFAVLGSVLLFPLLQLSYLLFLLAFTGFSMIPLIVAGYVRYVDALAQAPCSEVTKIDTQILSHLLGLKSDK